MDQVSLNDEAVQSAPGTESDSGEGLTGPKQFPAVSPDMIRQAFESGKYPYARLMGRVSYEAEKAKLQAVDLVLTDQNMPRMDGIGLTKKLRENPKFKTTPILILTTESSDQMKQAGRAAGATGWLVKPFDPAKLVEVIGKVIR